LDLIVEEKDEELDGLLSMDAALSSDVLWVERRADGEGIFGSRGVSGEIEMQRSGLEVGLQEPKVEDIEEKAGVRFWNQLKVWVSSVDWKSMLPLPTQAAILGVLVGCIGPARNLLYSEDAPLKPVSQALDLLGQGLIPSAIPLLGAVLSKGPVQSSITRAQVAGIVLITLLLQPWILTGIVIFAIKLGIFRIPNPMFLLILLLSNATPSAINLQTLTVLFNNGAEEMAQLLFWQYVFSLLSLPLNMWAFLSIIPLITK
jgi:predicted permease